MVGTLFGGVVGARLVDRTNRRRFDEKTLCKRRNVLGDEIFLM